MLSIVLSTIIDILFPDYSYLLFILAAFVSIISLLKDLGDPKKNNRVSWTLIFTAIGILILSMLQHERETSEQQHREVVQRLRQDTLVKGLTLQLETALRSNEKLDRLRSQDSMRGIITNKNFDTTKNNQLTTLDSIRRLLVNQTESLNELTGGHAFLMVDCMHPRRTQMVPGSGWTIQRFIVNRGKYPISQATVQASEYKDGNFRQETTFVQYDIPFLAKQLDLGTIRYSSPSNSKDIEDREVEENEHDIFFAFRFFQRNGEFQQYTRFTKIERPGYPDLWSQATVLLELPHNNIVYQHLDSDFPIDGKNGKIVYARKPLLEY